MATRNIRGTVSDRHGIPLLHRLELDVDSLETAIPANDDFVLSIVDGVFSRSLVSDLPSGSGSTTIFDILSGNSILTVSQPDISAADVTLTVDQTQIDHDQLTNFSANEHVDHTGVTLTAGVALSGGGDISASRTFNLDITELSEDTSPDEAADFLVTYDTSAGAHKKVKPSNVDHDNLTNGAGNKHVDHTSVTLTAGVALTGGGDISANRTFDFDLTELSEDTSPDESADYIVTYDASASAHKKVKLSNIDIANLSNSAPSWTVTTADVSNNTNTFADATPSSGPNLAFSIATSGNYWFKWLLWVQSDNTDNGCGLNISVPAGATGFYYRYNASGASAATESNVDNANLGQNVTTAAFPVANSNILCWLEGFITAGGTAGTVQLRFRSETGTTRTVTIKAGSVTQYKLSA